MFAKTTLSLPPNASLVPLLFTISYYDPVFGDTYHIDVDSEGDFVSATRYVVAIGRDPIVYYHLADLPRAHKSAIEKKIADWNPPRP